MPPRTSPSTRKRIEVLLLKGYRHDQIARIVGVERKTVVREAQIRGIHIHRPGKSKTRGPLWND